MFQTKLIKTVFACGKGVGVAQTRESVGVIGKLCRRRRVDEFHASCFMG